VAEQLNDKYLIEVSIGRGGMGEVFAGRALGVEGFSRPVAIKRIHSQYSDELRPTLIAEARLAARLSHCNIVTVHDLEQDTTGRLFLVMELVDGIDLASLLRTGALPLSIALFLTCEILRGLGHAHDLTAFGDSVRGLVHRDVSPSNILIGWNGAVKVSDFGLAKARATATASDSFFVKGKPAYMSPEQASRAAVDGRSDLFSVGVMLWEMICGERLFSHSSLGAEIPSPRSRAPGLSQNVEGIMMRLLERDPGRRYATAASAIEALLACAAYPKNGRELLSAFVAERLPARARPRSAESASSSSGEETALAPPVAPFFVPAEPYPDLPRSGVARRVALLALLVVATALVTMVAVGAFPEIGNRGAPAAPAARAAPPVEPPVSPRPPSEERAVMVTSASLPSSPAPPVPVAPPPAPPPQDHPMRASIGRGPAKDRQTPPTPTLESAGRNGIRVIDLRDLAPATSDRRE